ncbi:MULTISPECIES: SMP-30/gluconolactonase/LRE family protein [unclassified Caulobacter]|uniref:SMP-30/gluconolactonase/LRE family protein n=1 Tax=unclassified Caulobacter TaxID=2648921 RepID=UPI0006F6710B|nr:MULTISPECIES: SMP-30/gluconolactonase/LRE family protein [unclassified Caulobacter]KQV57711.1 gluconolactonase [Caulobacter sp. Root342]KQV67284.1 gluconolactonase [Caulobacter sp. Root343]
MTTRRAVLSAGVALIAGGRSMIAEAAPPAYPHIGRVRRLSPELDEIIAPDAVIEQLADGMIWSEGPVWIRDGGYLLFSDVPGNTMYRWSEKDGKTVFLKPSGYDGLPTTAFREPGVNGMTLDPAGEVVLCDHGNRAVSRLDRTSKKKTVIVDRYQGKRFNSPNDVIVARRGALKDTLYFTDPPYGLEGLDASPIKELAFNGVYLRRPNGEVAVVDDKLTFPNGLALSPDEKRLYVAVSDPKGPVIMAYDLGSDGLPASRKLFFDAAELLKAGGPGLPDGMRVDAKGRLFATGPGGVLILTPEAKLLGVIETGFPIANCTFGDDGKTLFLTSNHVLARLRTRTSGAV